MVRETRTGRRRISATVFILLICMIALYGFVSYRMPLPVLTAELSLPAADPAAAPTLPWPKYGEEAIGAEGYGVLASHNAGKPLPTASTAKVMTALAVLKRHPLPLGQQGPTLTLTAADMGYYDTYFSEDGSLVKVVAGEKITEYQALEAMLLPSANNMAESLAVWAFGSQAAYVQFANSYAKKLGMNDSHFADASGFSPLTVATASDLVLLGEASLQNPVLAHIVSLKSAKIPIAGTIKNVNWLLGDENINGIKTGSTDQDGGAYLFSAPHTYPSGQTVTVIGAIMGAKLLNYAMYDSIPLLQATETNFKPTTILHAGQSVGRYAVPWDIDVDAVAAKSLEVMSWQGRTITPQISFKRLQAPFAKGITVGTITTSIDPSQSISIITSHATGEPDWFWRTWRRL